MIASLLKVEVSTLSGEVSLSLASLLLDDAFLVVPLQILGADVAERAQYGVRMFAWQRRAADVGGRG